MRTETRRCAGGHVWVAVVVAIAALGCGVLIGFLAGTRRPSAQRVVDSLATPLPIPSGAKLLKRFDGGGGTSGRNWDQVSRGMGVALDVTGMTREQIEAIPEFYESYFNKCFPDLIEDSHWEWVDWEWETQGLGILGSLKSQNFSTGYGASWSWRRRGRVLAEHLYCEVYAEVMDFDELQPGSDFPARYPVKMLTDPIKGQRVMYVRLTLKGKGFNAKNLKWPARPASAPTTTAGS